MVGNPNNTSRLDEEVGAFSLNRTQLYVGTLSTDENRKLPAVSLLTGSAVHGPASQATIYTMTRDRAAEFLAFLDNVLEQRFPTSFRFPESETPSLLRRGQVDWIVSKYRENWHGGGGFVGTLGGESGHIMTKDSATKLRKCVSDLLSRDG